MPTVYLNGEYLPEDEARVPVTDRGFLLADGVYEVTPAYRGRFFRLAEHRERMAFGLRELRIDWDLDGLEEAHRQLLERNDLTGVEVSLVYFQVTRGCAPRTHAFPSPPCEPTLFGSAKVYERDPRERWEEGYRAITVPDRRWARADIKSIALLPNVLAQQAAVESDAKDALLVKDGTAIEGSHNNVFFVFGGTAVTHPPSHQILGGITRDFVLELCRDRGIPVEERAVPIEEARRADEIFFTGTTTEVRPSVELDGEPVGDGTVGPVARRLYDAFVEGVARETGGEGGAGEQEAREDLEAAESAGQGTAAAVSDLI